MFTFSLRHWFSEYFQNFEIFKETIQGVAYKDGPENIFLQKWTGQNRTATLFWWFLGRARFCRYRLKNFWEKNRTGNEIKKKWTRHSYFWPVLISDPPVIQNIRKKKFKILRPLYNSHSSGKRNTERIEDKLLLLHALEENIKDYNKYREELNELVEEIRSLNDPTSTNEDALRILACSKNGVNMPGGLNVKDAQTRASHINKTVRSRLVKFWYMYFSKDIWAEFQFLSRIFNFWAEFQVLSRILIFEQNFNFWPNFNFWAEFQFLRRISIFEKNFNFWATFLILIVSIFNLTF